MGNNDKWTDRQSEGEKDRRREKLVLAIGISKIYIKSKKSFFSAIFKSFLIVYVRVANK